jgi:asparagine synthase (glutamine-hydrolysing)
MCGIAGIINKTTSSKENNQQMVSQMLNTMKHRGPDDNQILNQKDATIGINRLSIVDPIMGKQPMLSKYTTWAIVFNGEIYNFKELKQGLGSQNQTNFQTESDTEVLLKLFENEMQECICKLNGMFAFCITDGEAAYLVRDRLGIKPLYYRLDDGNLIFASETKALITEVVPSLNIERTYHEFESNIGNETLFAGIFEVPPGAYIKYDSITGKLSVHYYYKLDNIATKAISRFQAIEEMKWLVEDSIKIRTDTDLSYTCLVSGGIDSTIVALLSKPSYTFSAIVGERDYLDEKSFLNAYTQKSNSCLIRIEPTPEDFKECFAKIIYALDFPVTTLASFSQFLLAREIAKKNIKIVLSGLGADEHLGGYIRHVALLFPEERNKIEAILPAYKPLFSKAESDQCKRSDAWRYYQIANRGTYNSLSGYRVVNNKFRNSNSLLNAATRFDLSITLPPLLRADDRLNMYHSIEARAPFLDYRIIEFSLSLEDRLKISFNALSGDLTTKYVLREAFRDLLPHDIYQQKQKIGFPSPVTLWLNTVFLNLVKNSYEILNFNDETQQLFNRKIIHDNYEFSRKEWLMVQFAAWYLLFFKKYAPQEVTEILFKDR